MAESLCTEGREMLALPLNGTFSAMENYWECVQRERTKVQCVCWFQWCKGEHMAVV